MNRKKKKKRSDHRERRQRAKKEKEPCHQKGKEIKLNCHEIQDTHTETIKEVLKYMNGRYIPLVWLLED